MNKFEEEFSWIGNQEDFIDQPDIKEIGKVNLQRGSLFNLKSRYWRFFKVRSSWNPAELSEEKRLV